MARANLEGNPNLRDALRYARQLGLTVERAEERTGELRITDPATGESVLTSSQRRSTSRHVMKLLRRAEERQKHRGDPDGDTDPGVDRGPAGPASS